MNNTNFLEQQVLTCCETGASVRLIKQIKKGLEGTIWEIQPHRDYLAKLYHQVPSPEQGEKLKAMVESPPDNPTSEDNHVSIAWPNRMLQDEQGNIVGFLMPYIKESVTVPRIYNLGYRKKENPGFNWRCLHGTAQNLASIVWAIHRKGHVLCDISDKNLLVNPQNSYVSIIDTDSFQIADFTTKKIYKSPVLGTPEYIPPELQNIKFDMNAIDRTEVHDRFALAIVIYRLLFGYSPFRGGWPFDDEEVCSVEDYISRGYWLHGRNDNQLKHPKDIIPIEVVHPKIQDCFYRCFDDGYKEPNLRPTAKDWFGALESAIADLKPCEKQPNHYYNSTYKKCYWCDDDYDRFPLLDQNIVPEPDPAVLPTQIVVEIVTSTAKKNKFSLDYYNVKSKAIAGILLITISAIALIFWLLKPKSVPEPTNSTAPTVNLEIKTP